MLCDNAEFTRFSNVVVFVARARVDDAFLIVAVAVRIHFSQWNGNERVISASAAATGDNDIINSTDNYVDVTRAM